MPIKQLNHCVLYVRNVQRSMDFYVGLLGFRVVNQMGENAAFLEEAGNLIGASDHGTTKALYAKDPDGLEFEVSWLVPAQLLHMEPGGMKTAQLNLGAEISRYGAETLGGVGVSH
jgi:catechol 2,3-dioxygenase-like lactoylglutathione lyase family enzyme